MATKYWVGGDGDWSSTSSWSTSSGGAGGTFVPNSSDNVIIDNNSASGAFTITLTGISNCNDITFNQTTRSLSLSGNGNTLSVYGSWYSSASASFSNILTAGNLSFLGSNTGRVFEARGRSYCTGSVFGSPYTVGIAISSSSSIMLVGGLTTNQLSLTAGIFDLNGQTATAKIFSSSPNPFVPTSRRVNFNGGNITVAGYASAAVTAVNISDAATLFSNDQLGEIRIGLASGGTSYSNSVANIRIGSAGSIAEADSLNINVNSTSTAAFSTSGAVNNITAIAGSRVTGGTLYVYGNLNSSSTFSSVTTYVFKSTSGPKTITVSSVGIGNMTFDGVGGSWELSQNTTLNNGTLTLTNGTFDANDKNITGGFFSSSNTNTRSLYMGSGTWSLNGSGTVWDCATSTGLNVTPETAVISLTSPLSKTFAGGGKTWPTLRQTGTGQLTITGSNSFTDIQNTVQPCTVLFEAGSTNTFDSDFSLSGTGTAARVTIGSTASPSPFYLEASFGEVSVVYCSLSNSRVISPNKWYALLNQGNLNTGGNEGWVFSVVSPGAFMAFF